MQKVNLVMINRFHGRSVWVFEDTMRCLAHLLNQAGFHSQITANYLDPEAINILFGVGMIFSHAYEEVEQFSLKHSTIIFNCEQLESNSTLVTEEYLEFLAKFVVMDWCHPNIDAIRRRLPHARHGIFEMPLFPTAGFSAIDYLPATELRYDLAFYGGTPPRREKLLAELEQEGVTVKKLAHVWGDALNNQLQDCRYVLNMHSYETDLLETNRFLRPLSLGIPMISEASTLPGKGDWHEAGIQFAPTVGFGKAVKAILDNPDNHALATRKAVRFVNRRANVQQVKEVMDQAIVALAALRPNAV